MYILCAYYGTVEEEAEEEEEEEEEEEAEDEDEEEDEYYIGQTNYILTTQGQHVLDPVLLPQ